MPPSYWFAQILHLRKLAMLKQGLFATALVFFSSLCHGQANSDNYEKALSLYANKNYDEAEIAVKNSIQKNPNYLPARLLLGKILLDQGQFSAAEKELTLSLNMRADSYIVVLPLVETKLLLEKPEQALELLTQYEQLAGEKDYYLLKGNAEKALRQFDNATLAYQFAIEVHGENAKVLTALADLYLAQANNREALTTIERALTLDVNYLPALLLKAELLKQDKLFAQALTQYQVINQIEPENKQALFGQASVLLAQNNIDEALIASLKLRELAPDDPYAKLLYSSLLTLQGDAREGKQVLANIQQQILNLSDKQQDAKEVLLLSGSVDFINQNFQQARIKLQRYLRDYGEHAVVRRHLATISLRNNDIKQAELHITKAIELNPGESELLLLASVIFQQTQSAEEHLQYMQKLYDNHQNNTLIKQKYISALINSGNYKRAETLLSDNSQNELVSKTLLGFLQLEQLKLDDARVTTQYLLDNYPNKVEVLQLAGELSLKIAKEQDAIALFKQALVLDETFRPALLALAGISLNSNDLIGAESYYQQVLTHFPRDTDTLQLYADLAIKQQQFLLAIKLLSSLPEPNITSKENLGALLSLYLATNQLKQAEQTASQLRELDPFGHEYLIARSQLEHKLGQTAKAQKTLKVLFGLVYDSAQQLQKVALLQLELKDADAASKTIDRYNELNEHPSAYLAARLALETNDLITVATTLDALSYDERKIQSWQELNGFYQLASNKPHQALPIFQSLFDQYQQRQHLQILAQLYANESQSDKLKSLLKKWLKTQPLDAWAVAQLTTVAEQTNDRGLAIATLENYPAINEHPLFLNNLANMYQDKDLNKAIELAQRAYDLLQNFAPINDTLGWLLVKQGKLEQGVSYLREAISRDNKNAVYHYHLAIALAKLQRFDLAKLSQAKAKTLNSNHPLAAITDQLIP